MKKTRNTLFFTFLFFSLCTFSQEKIKVACIGNSITFGAGIKKEQAYPAQLQLFLGDNYEVHNYGISGRTLLNKGDNPYMKEPFFSDALKWEPDIVVIKLGTNDSKPQNWKYRDEFINNYLTMVKAFKSLPSCPKVYVCYPVPAFESRWGITDSVISKEVIPRITKVKKKSRSELIDLRTPFLGRDSLFSDGIHPNPLGSKFIAEEVYKSITKKNKK